jgi:hypothetical protein
MFLLLSSAVKYLASFQLCFSYLRGKSLEKCSKLFCILHPRLLNQKNKDILLVSSAESIARPWDLLVCWILNEKH